VLMMSHSVQQDMYQMHYYELPARKLGTHPKGIPKVNPAGEQEHETQTKSG
jgi:hypothetical protein